MQLKDWTLVRNKEGEPRAAFAAKGAAEAWRNEIIRVSQCLALSTVTLDLPAPPPRDPNVIAREYMEAVKLLRDEDNEAAYQPIDRLYAEWEAATAPKPPAEAKPSPGRIKPPLLVADILDDGKSWGILDSNGSLITGHNMHTREEMAYIVAAVNAYAGVPVEGAGGE